MHHTHTVHESSYHLHLQFPDLFIQTLPARVLAGGVVGGGQLGVPPQRGRVFSHPPEQTLWGLPADFHLQVLQIWDGLAGRALIHLLQTEEIRKQDVSSLPLGRFGIFL